MAEVGGCGKDTTNSKYTLLGVPENNAREIFSGTSCTRLWLEVDPMASWVL